MGQRMRANPPRCSSSRPLPPRPVTPYFAVLIVCSAPRVVSTVSRSRSPVDAMKPRTRSSLPTLISSTPLPGPDRKFTSSAFARSPRPSAVAAISTSPPASRATPTISDPFDGLANRRPARVLGSTNASRPNESALPSELAATAYVSG